MAATSGSWTTLPFGDVAPIPYRARFDGFEYAKLKLGLIPRSMEEKWFVEVDEPWLILHRSWTGQPVYKVEFRDIEGGAETVQALCSAELVAASGPEEQAKLLSSLIGSLLLREARPEPLAPEPGGADQNTVVGHEAPREIEPKRPWWKFWR